MIGRSTPTHPPQRSLAARVFSIFPSARMGARGFPIPPPHVRPLTTATSTAFSASGRAPAAARAYRDAHKAQNYTRHRGAHHSRPQGPRAVIQWNSASWARPAAAYDARYNGYDHLSVWAARITLSARPAARRRRTPIHPCSPAGARLGALAPHGCISVCGSAAMRHYPIPIINAFDLCTSPTAE